MDKRVITKLLPMFIGCVILLIFECVSFADVTFTDVSKEAGIDRLGWWEGAAFGDYDADGYLDIYIANTGGPNVLYHNNGDSTFTDVAPELNVNFSGFSVATIWGDYDNDGDIDLYVTTAQNNLLYRNDGKKGFTDEAIRAGVTTPVWGQSAVFLDYNNDGYLDIYALEAKDGQISKLYRNNGDGTFTDVADKAKVACPLGYGLASGDYDNDGDIDLYVSAPVDSPSIFYRNNGDGTFSDVTKKAGVQSLDDGRGAVFGDYDNDGYLDLYVVFGDIPNRLYHNNGDGTFTDVADKAGVADEKFGDGAAFADYDNDGYLDLYVANFGENVLYHNNGDGTFTNVSEMTKVNHPGRSFSSIFDDYDNDGDLDLLVTNGAWGAIEGWDFERSVLYRNDGPTGNWLRVNLIGVKSNLSGIGARIKVNCGQLSMIREVSGGSGYGHQESLSAKFGLGQNSKVNILKVLWPSGQVEVYGGIPANQAITIKEGQGITSGQNVKTFGNLLTTLGKVKYSALYQNYPNPFNPETWIPFALAEDASVTISIYDVKGYLIRRFELGRQGAGIYTSRDRTLYWDGRNDIGERVSSGTYFYQLRAGKFTAVRKLAITK